MAVICHIQARVIIVFLPLASIKWCSSTDVIVIEPSVSLAGQRVSVRCISSQKKYETEWHFLSFSSSSGHYADICAGDKVRDDYKAIFKTCNNSELGSSIIDIASVTVSHAGTYKCCSEERTEEDCYATGDLTVLEELPACVRNDLIRDRLNCRIKAAGNLVPVVRCPSATPILRVKNINNTYEYSIELDVTLARACNICFEIVGNSNLDCVHSFGFEGIPTGSQILDDESMITNITKAPELKSGEREPTGSSPWAPIVIVVIVVTAVVIVAGAVVAFVVRKCKRNSSPVEEAEEPRTPTSLDSGQPLLGTVTA